MTESSVVHAERFHHARDFHSPIFASRSNGTTRSRSLSEKWKAGSSRGNFGVNGYGREQLAEMQKVIEAENSDLFDVLAYVAFAIAPLARQDRAEAARKAARTELTDKQRAFIDFVLAQYVDQGVEELDQEKLAPLLKLKYRALPEAFAELGKPDQVRKVFIGFQRHLYEPPTGAR